MMFHVRVIEAGAGCSRARRKSKDSMKVPWLDDKCIICLGHDALSEEHVIPAALGGDLKCDFLCKPWNDRFGASFEARKTDPAIRTAKARAKTDPAIRTAVAALRSEIPVIHDGVEDGQQYFAQFGKGLLRR